ncbi:MAG: hypothetical protein OIF34_13890, partial [Porticoccaceae bacterium]|nr:hypothetical protein [Porticoccaceae bacterium]
MKYLSFVPAATLAALCVSAHAQDGSGSSKKERANTPKKDVIEEVLIQATQREKAEPSLLTEKLSNTAGTLGDPIRGIFALPGIIQADEESGEPSVRGSGPHENEFIVDFLPTGYIFHLFGNSIFDENLLHDFGIQAAGFGADYGYATGAVFDVSLRDPRAQPIRPIVDLSFLQAGAMVEGEIADSHTFYASYRNSLIHMFVSDEGDNEDGIVVNKQPVSKDYQFKYLWRPGNHHRLSWTVIGASDAAAETITAKAQEAILDPGGIGRQSVDSSFVSSGLVWDWDGVDWTTKTGLGYLKEQFKDRLGKSEQQTFTVEQLTLRAEATRRMAKHKFKLGTELRQNDITYDVLMRQENCSDFDPGCEFKR